MKYEIAQKTIGQYDLSTLPDSPFVLFEDKVNQKIIYIPKRIVNEMYHLIQNNWQEEIDYKETYQAI